MNRIGGVVLAAGGSTRLGQPKQLLEFGGKTLVHAAVRAALGGGCDLVCVVTGRDHEAVARAVDDLPVTLVRNDDWQRGTGSSVRLGVTAVQAAYAAVLLACDQPAVNGAVIRALIERRAETGALIVTSYYQETMGIPALFDRSCFPELLHLPDDRGAKVVIQADMARVAHVDFPAGAFDLDSPEDLREWRAREMRKSEMPVSKE